jgi:hypothetical protein
MRTCVLAACLLLFSSSAFGQSYVMKVHLSTGQTTTISSDDISRIEFANLTAGVEPSLPAHSTGVIQFLGSYPNPFWPSTTIEYVIASRADVRARVYDLNGGLVRELQNDNVAAGRHQLTWDGTNKSRARVPSGLYFLKMECGAQAISRRLILIK